MSSIIHAGVNTSPWSATRCPDFTSGVEGCSIDVDSPRLPPVQRGEGSRRLPSQPACASVCRQGLAGNIETRRRHLVTGRCQRCVSGSQSVRSLDVSPMSVAYGLERVPVDANPTANNGRLGSNDKNQYKHQCTQALPVNALA